ncbi:mannan endo-1,4-beta-mannosidase [Kitasatospora sp. MAP12-15]|uniref:glycoside hydrolase family 26 protein n=1 Tax=unclassified Kitasatospora TaxID=2633591 RepID=UPI00247595D1|nr:glycosyl hydrolase [Kitasatospora sp. MAP12-44]MDH6109206.1 mannan endo-1,4-beta-mannosidase [Kitasatospora sp. MAP12-44]
MLGHSGLGDRQGESTLRPDWRKPSWKRHDSHLRIGAFAATVVLVAGLLIAGSRSDAGPAPASVPDPRLISSALTDRDPKATANAQAVYGTLVGLENAARGGTPRGTILGQHEELHNERLNPEYGDRPGLKQPGYYYQRTADLTGRLAGFVEADLGPGYGQSGWGAGDPRSYSSGKWPTCRPGWQYTDDVVDLLEGVWDGLPRPADGSYYTGGTQQNCDGSTTTLPENGGAPAGVVGLSFHEPYPGSAVKSFDEVQCSQSPAAHDPGWFDRVIDWHDNTPEYQALLGDLSYLADHLSYLSDHGVPVLFRPYHEMNAPSCATGFWWADQSPEKFKALWRIMYNYLVNTRGLHNLIFVWSPAAWNGVTGTDPAAYYPGGQYVDVVGVDDYSSTPATVAKQSVWTAQWYKGLEPYRKPRMLAESFYVPVNQAQRDTLSRTPWVIWSVWGQAITADNATEPRERNTQGDLMLSFRSPLAITGGGRAQGSTFDWRRLHQS